MPAKLFLATIKASGILKIKIKIKNMPRRTQAKKTTMKKEKTNSVGLKKSCRKDMRFSISLVVLIGMLTFSLLLLLVSLDKPVAISARTKMIQSIPRLSLMSSPETAPESLTTFSGGGGDFQLSIPADWKGWVYRIGAVKSPIDDTLSDQYVKIYLPDPNSAQSASPNLDSRFKDIITVVNYSADEWKALDKKCSKGDSSVCGIMGTKLAGTQCADSSESADCVYGYTKAADCSGALAAKCNEVDKIMASFKLK